MNAEFARIGVLVVDDSAFMCKAISRILEREPDIAVLATAASGEEAIALAEKFQPDVITMDVEMPGIGGLEAVRAIAARQTCAIIMLSALTSEGAEVTLRALELGAIDFICKPNASSIDILRIGPELVEKVRAFAGRRQSGRRARPLAVVPPPSSRNGAQPGRFACIGVGTSTGGPAALSAIIPLLPENFPVPILIVQHMPPGFTRPLAERLNAISRVRVTEALSGLPLLPGLVAIAPAGRMCRINLVGGSPFVKLDDDIEGSLHVPSVDVMAASLGEAFGAGALGVILTGMGQDGVEGLRVLKARGGFVIGQDEETSVVYGMPRAAAAAKLVDRVVPLHEVAAVLCELTGNSASVL